MGSVSTGNCTFNGVSIPAPYTVTGRIPLSPGGYAYVFVSLYRGTGPDPCSFSGLAELPFPSFTRRHAMGVSKNY
jgi:hypothetical protein